MKAMLFLFTLMLFQLVMKYSETKETNYEFIKLLKMILKDPEFLRLDKNQQTKTLHFIYIIMLNHHIEAVKYAQTTNKVKRFVTKSKNLLLRMR